MSAREWCDLCRQYTSGCGHQDRLGLVEEMMSLEGNVKRPCCDCYRLVRATFENEVGGLLLKHLRRGELPAGDAGRDANLICHQCGAVFVSYSDDDAMERKVFWVGWVVQ